MDEIKWLEVAINTTPERLDEITAKLTAAGMTGLVIEDEAEFQQFLEQNRQYWDYVDQELLDGMKGVTRVKFYVTDDTDGRAQLTQYTHGLECEYTTRTLVDNDWAYSWQKYYKPLSIGERLYVVPQWEREEPVPQGRVPFYLNPGLTFGTGSHASTQLCLEGVEAHTREGDRVLDLGCGSGILSIAALVLGAERASAVDIDPKAVDVAYENAALNGIGKDRYTVRAGDVLTDRALAAELAQERYQLVLANIVADVIIPLAPQVPGLLAEGGVFLCSGIIDSRAKQAGGRTHGILRYTGGRLLGAGDTGEAVPGGDDRRAAEPVPHHAGGVRPSAGGAVLARGPAGGGGGPADRGSPGPGAAGGDAEGAGHNG